MIIIHSMIMRFDTVLLALLQITCARNVPKIVNVEQSGNRSIINHEFDLRSPNAGYPLRPGDYHEDMQIRINREPSISDYRPHNADFEQKPHELRKPNTKREEFHSGRRLETGFSNRRSNEDFAERRNNFRVTMRPLFTNTYPGDINANLQEIYGNKPMGKQEVNVQTNRNMDVNILGQDSKGHPNHENDQLNPNTENYRQNFDSERNNNIIKTSYNTESSVPMDAIKIAYIQTNTEPSVIKDIDRINVNSDKIFFPPNESVEATRNNSNNPYVNTSFSKRKLINNVNTNVENPNETYENILSIYSNSESSSTTENKVVPHKTPITRPISTKPVNGDKWFWPDEITTTTTASKVDVDDRAAFDGDKCPTGTTRLDDKCVEMH